MTHRLTVLAAILCVLISYLSNSLRARADESTPESSQITRAGLKDLLSFESPQTGGFPSGWDRDPVNTITAVHDIVHGGNWAAKIDRNAESHGAFSSLTLSIPIDFKGSTLELRGFLRTHEVTGFAGLWMREDAGGRMLELDNMQEQALKGTQEWGTYSISIPLNAEANQLAFGVLLDGTGTLWADELQLLVDGKQIADAPFAVPIKTVLDTDREFDAGSKMDAHLTQVQVDSLFTLCKVWGFLKYHHPKVTSGQRNWDYDLFRALPAVLAAGDHAAAVAAITQWVNQLGPITTCMSCATKSGDDVHLQPDLRWIFDERRLGPGLSRALQESTSTARQMASNFTSLAQQSETPDSSTNCHTGHLKRRMLAFSYWPCFDSEHHRVLVSVPKSNYRLGQGTARLDSPHRSGKDL